MLVLDAHRKKSYHLGLGKHITRSNLAKANSSRSSLVFEEFACHMIAVARTKCKNVDLGIDSQVYLFDSKTIELCLSVFWWASFRKRKEESNAYLLRCQQPYTRIMHITTATLNDVNAIDQLSYESNAFYIFDRAYLYYTRLYRFNAGVYFLIRTKSNHKFRRTYSCKSEKENGILCDQIGKLSGYYTARDYPQRNKKSEIP